MIWSQGGNADAKFTKMCDLVFPDMIISLVLVSGNSNNH